MTDNDTSEHENPRFEFDERYHVRLTLHHDDGLWKQIDSIKEPGKYEVVKVD